MDIKSQSKLAKQGESLAAQYMIAHGYYIATRNYHSAYGEIDFIALKTDEIIFAEVKTRKNHSLKSAEDSITMAKQKKITLTAMHFLAQNPQYSHLSCRFDVLIVFQYPDDTYKILHYPDAFKPTEINNY